MTDHPAKPNDSGQMTAAEVGGIPTEGPSSEARHLVLAFGNASYNVGEEQVMAKLPAVGAKCDAAKEALFAYITALESDHPIPQQSSNELVGRIDAHIAKLREVFGGSAHTTIGLLREAVAAISRPTPPPEVVARHEAGELVEEVRFLLDRLNDFELDETDAKEMCRQYMGHIEPAISRVQAALSRRAPDPARPADVEGKELPEICKWLKSIGRPFSADAIEALAAQLSEKSAEIERLTKWNWAMAKNVKLAENQLAAARGQCEGKQLVIAQLETQLAAATARVGKARKVIAALLQHSCIGDIPAEDKFPEDHDAERAARDWLNKEGGK